MEKITSEQNTRIKNIIRLREKSRERKKQGLFLIDGERELREAIRAGFDIKEIYICQEINSNEFDFNYFSISSEVFQKICYKEKPDGCLAVASSRRLGVDSLDLNNKPLIVVLEAVEKPGNLGAVVRSAYAAGADAIIINGEQTDIYNPNVIRASQGLVFNIPVISLSFEETLEFFKKNNIKIFSAALGGDKIYTDVDFKEASAIVLGTESEGLSDRWLKNSDQIIRIPMKENIDSLNVSVSAAILIFEAWRQRGFN